MECKPKFAEIVPGSKAEFDLVLTADGRPFDFTPYIGGNLVFLNTFGVRTVVPLVVPGPTPSSGILPVSISSVLTADADTKWKDADLELTAVLVADNKVEPIYDKFKITKRNAPPTV